MHWYLVEGLARERHERLLAEAAERRLRSRRPQGQPRRGLRPRLSQAAAGWLAPLLRAGQLRSSVYRRRHP